jgi:glycosyltransferase involved in cell wall biosynthesis
MPQPPPTTNQDAPPEVVVSLAAPAFNEEQAIEAVVEEWKQTMDHWGIRAEFVICNDGSTDRTAAILNQLQARLSQLRVVGGTQNQGYGHALTAAIQACRGQYIATIDSDGQFDPAAIVDFLKAIQADGADGCVGYRVKKGDTLLRVAADRCLNVLVRLLFATHLRDTNCALKVVRRDLLQSIRLESTGFPLPTEICIKLQARGARLLERPVQHRQRPSGESKLKVWRTGWRTFRFLLYLRARARLYRAGLLQDF